MDERLVRAEGLLKAGQRSEAADLIIQVLEETPDQPAHLYRVLVTQLYRQERYDEGAAWAEKAVARAPKDFDLWNLKGVILRRMKRYDEALKALDQAQRLNPKSTMPLINKGNVYNDSGAGPQAEAIYIKLSRNEPRNAEFQRGLGRALVHQKKYEPAVLRLRQAVTLKKDYLDAWIDLLGVESLRERHDEALALADRALEAVPGEPRLLESKAMLLRRCGRLRAAVDFLQGLLPAMEDQAWLQFQLAAALSEFDRPRANVHYARAVELNPSRAEYVLALAESQDRTREGDEGANIQAGYDTLVKGIALSELNSVSRKIAHEILIRVGEYDAADALGSFSEIGREWATTGRHTALLKHLGRATSPEDRLELITQHRMWGEMVEADARRLPLKRSTGPRPSGKIRLGFMSSDLRAHPVAYFALPLFEHIDHERFEVFCYSYYQGNEADPTQKHLMSLVDGFRWKPDISDREAAQMIADDQLDMLIELGGSTHMNKLAVMAYKPARLSASWLGYPHSTGLKIDYLIVDPYLKPPKPELLIEQPLEMPNSWIAMGRLAFPEGHLIDPVPPVKRTGVLTFGTANNPYKYGPEMLRTWARVLRETPNSRFLFLRPEGGAHTFRDNMRAAFAAEGVAGERIMFHAVRGTHMKHYNDMDITLDTFPQTGGTTTCESLWMGVPAVGQVGEALFERLTYSILNNAGLGDLCGRDSDEMVQIAVRLAQDVDRIADLRVNLRGRLKGSPLGQTKQFAADFYDMIARAVQARLGAKLSA